jgi:uncharacterized protein YlxP (DUF503 family)
MKIALLLLTFHLEGCESLKEKRARLRGIKDRFGKISNLAVSEVDYHDKHQSSQWAFLSLVSEKPLAEKMFASIQDYANSHMDALITQVTIEWL